MLKDTLFLSKLFLCLKMIQIHFRLLVAVVSSVVPCLDPTMARVTPETQPGDVIDEPTSPIHPIAPFPPLFVTSAETEFIRKPVKRAAGGRAPEFYGFVAWLVTLLVYVTYVLWTFLPDEVIRAVGIEWYPARFVVPVCDNSTNQSIAGMNILKLNANL